MSTSENNHTSPWGILQKKVLRIINRVHHTQLFLLIIITISWKTYQERKLYSRIFINVSYLYGLWHSKKPLKARCPLRADYLFIYVFSLYRMRRKETMAGGQMAGECWQMRHLVLGGNNISLKNVIRPSRTWRLKRTLFLSRNVAGTVF